MVKLKFIYPNCILVPSDYGKKKASTKELRVCSSKGRKEEVYESEEEEEACSEAESEEEYIPESGDDRSEADESHSERSGSEAEEDVEEAPAHNVSPPKHTKTAKRKAEVVRVKPAQQAHPNPAKKPKTTHTKPAKNTNEVKEAVKEVKYKTASVKAVPAEAAEEPMDTKDEKEEKKTANKPAAMFSDKNVDLDLFHSSPTNVVSTKVKISPNLIMTSRNIDQLDGAKANGQMYDFAALTFQRKINNGKLFEFVIPLGLAPKCLQAIQHIIDKNEKFFKPQDV